ncbi:MAG: nucleotidyltransferase family protein [Alphaproteobacteria bacterium]|nr:nucleotidyltransferase family protein [Alphaproteobacteria bacterium]
MSAKIDTAMVLAAGLGKRMRPLTDNMPKPMVPLAGRPLIDHALDRLVDVGIKQAVVNVHYKAEALEQHLARRTSMGRGPAISISDERGVLLETGGGIVKALPMIGDHAFLVCNSDTTWLEDDTGQTTPGSLHRLISEWDETQMDCLLLLAQRNRSLGYTGDGDFHLGSDGRLTRRAKGEETPFVFAGVSIAHPRLFANVPDGAFSLNVIWDRAIASGRLYGVELDGWWMHVGTPAALDEAEAFAAQLMKNGTGAGKGD